MTEVLPPGSDEPIEVDDGFVHEPHAPWEACPLGPMCEAPGLEWGVGPPPPRPYIGNTIAGESWKLKQAVRELGRAFLEDTLPGRLFDRLLDWIADRCRTEPETCDACGRDMLPAGRVAGRVVRWKCPSCPIEKVPHR